MWSVPVPAGTVRGITTAATTYFGFCWGASNTNSIHLVTQLARSLSARISGFGWAAGHSWRRRHSSGKRRSNDATTAERAYAWHNHVATTLAYINQSTLP